MQHVTQCLRMNGVAGKVDSMIAAEDNRSHIFNYARGHVTWGLLDVLSTHTFNYRYCCSKRMSQLSLVDGVTSESNYQRFVRHCSSIFLCERALVLSAWHSSSLAVLQKGEAAENSMKLKRLYALFLFISRSLSLVFCAALEGWGGTGEKVRGNKQQKAQ